jgi:hypothetical protein
VIPSVRLLVSMFFVLGFGACRAGESLVKSQTAGYWVSTSTTSDGWQFLYYGPDGRGAAAFFSDQENGSEFCFQGASEMNGVMTANLEGSHFPRASIFFAGYKTDQTTGLLTGAIFLFSRNGSREELMNTIFLRMSPVVEATQIPGRAKQLLKRCGIDKASGRYALSDDLQSTLDAHSSAANLPPLRGSMEDEVRVWIHGYMAADIEGFVVSRRGAIKCHTTYDYEDGVVSMNQARCRRWHAEEGVIGTLDDLAALDGKEWDCEAEDGVEVLVEGVRDGKRFVLRAGNPAFCNDPSSETVVAVLNKLRR